MFTHNALVHCDGSSVKFRSGEAGFIDPFLALMLMMRLDVVLYCHPLLDVVNILSKLSLTIQKTYVTIGSVFQAMEVVKKSLQKLKNK